MNWELVDLVMATRLSLRSLTVRREECFGTSTATLAWAKIGAGSPI